jgi:hypothetical protein
MASVPAVASGTLPRTGASTTLTPLGRRCAMERTSSGPTVDMSMSNCPEVSAPTTPPSNSTSSSAAGVASIVMTTSAPAIASTGVSAAEAPRSTSGPSLALVRFQTLRS